MLALLGGDSAVTAEDHDYYTQWPIYTEEEVEVVSSLIRTNSLSSASGSYGPNQELEELVCVRRGDKDAIAHSSRA